MCSSNTLSLSLSLSQAHRHAPASFRVARHGRSLRHALGYDSRPLDYIPRFRPQSSASASFSYRVELRMVLNVMRWVWIIFYSYPSCRVFSLLLVRSTTIASGLIPLDSVSRSPWIRSEDSVVSVWRFRELSVEFRSRYQMQEHNPPHQFRGLVCPAAPELVLHCPCRRDDDDEPLVGLLERRAGHGLCRYPSSTNP